MCLEDYFLQEPIIKYRDMNINFNPSLSVAFSGHRVIPNIHRKQVKRLLNVEIEKAYNMGYRYFYCGMAKGFDLLAAEAALSLRLKLTRLQVIAVIPHLEQTAFWCEQDKVMYDSILKKVNKRIILSQHYYQGCLLKRNDYLLAHSNLLIAFYNGFKRGGTYYTYRRALNNGLKTINLYERIET